MVSDLKASNRARFSMDTDTILLQYKNLVYHVITRMVYDRNCHEDLFQEAFLNILNGLPEFKGCSKLATWIYSVTANTCLNHLRAVSRHRADSLEEWLADDSGLADPSIPPGDPIEPGTGQMLEHALNRLSPKYRMPIALYYIENMSYKEIAECLQIPMGTVKTNLYRGLRQMKDFLGGDINAFL